jgi:LmbE family N-acetylglucosaminyl deacetylase
MMKLRILAVGAHPADVQKRAGGTVARYASEGHEVYSACLTFGETQESQLLWKKPNMTTEKVKSTRRKEFLDSCEIVGIKPVMLGFDDNFPINPLTEKNQAKIAEMIRETKPHIVLTHWLMTLYDDHRLTAKALCFRARELAADPDKLKESGLEPWKVEDIYFYEPAEKYSSVTGFLEDVYVDVTDFWEAKMKSLEPFWYSQRNNADYYTKIAIYCGTQAGVRYAERFVQFRTKRVFELFPEPGNVQE